MTPVSDTLLQTLGHAHDKLQAFSWIAPNGRALPTVTFHGTSDADLAMYVLEEQQRLLDAAILGLQPDCGQHRHRIVITESRGPQTAANINHSVHSLGHPPVIPVCTGGADFLADLI